MKKSINSLTKIANKWDKIPEKEQYELFDSLYNDHGLSWIEIADLCGTYPNKVRRKANKIGVESRDKSEAQKLALEANRASHPTEGTERPDDVKEAISNKMAEVWENLTEEEKEYRRQLGREAWDKMSDGEKQEFHQKAIEAVQLAAKEGSKLEKYIHDQLVLTGHKVIFHKEHHLKNERVHLDILIPDLKLVIEIDGPSHHKPVWGTKALNRTQSTDKQKDGLLITMGYRVLRVKQSKRLSQKYMRDIWSAVEEVISDDSDTRRRIELEV